MMPPSRSGRRDLREQVLDDRAAIGRRVAVVLPVVVRRAATEVLVDLKRPPLSRLSPEESNYFRFRLGPMVSLSIGARVKKPGAEAGSVATELVAVRDAPGDEVDAYERLLTDAMKGDPTLFVREDAVEAAWAVVDRILDHATSVQPYEPGSWGPAEAGRLTEGLESWHDPAGGS